MNLKSKFLDVLGRVMTPRCLNFILISSMGPRNSTKDTHVIFQPTLVHRSMCMQFIFRLCTLKVQKLNQCIKRPNEPGIIPKFNRALIQFYVASVNKIRGEAAYIVSHTKVTRSLSEPRGLLRESPVLQEAYTKTCPNSAKNYTYENRVQIIPNISLPRPIMYYDLNST